MILPLQYLSDTDNKSTCSENVFCVPEWKKKIYVLKLDLITLWINTNPIKLEREPPIQL